MLNKGLIIISFLLIIGNHQTLAQSIGGWGTCEFATVTTMNAFDPSSTNFDCKKVFVQATNEHYRWNGTAWELDGGNDNIYNTDGTLDSDRWIGLSTHNLYLSAPSDQEDILHLYRDFNSANQKISLDFDGNNSSGNLQNFGQIKITPTDITTGSVDAQFSIELPLNGTKSELFQLNPSGQLRFNNYGGAAAPDFETGNEVYVLGVEADGDVVEIDPSTLGSNDNIYNTSDALTGDRVVDLDGNDLTFSGTNDVFIESTGNVGINTTSPSEELDVVGDAEITNHLYVGPDAGTSNNTTMRLRENFSSDNSTYQLYSTPTITSPVLSTDRASYGAYIRVLNNKTEDVAGGNDSDAIGGSFRSYISGTNTFRSLYGVQGYAYNQSTAAANLGNLYGGYFRAYNNATSGTIPNAYGGYGYAYTVNGRGSDITNAYGLYGRVKVDSDDGGDITTGRAGYFLTHRRNGANLMTNAYGIQIDANDGQTVYGIRVDTDDTDPTTNYGIYIDANGASSNNYGIYGERGDWILDQDGNGNAGGTGASGDLILGEGQDLELYHDGSNSHIINNTGDLNISSSTTNDIHLSINGGNVGIGTTTPNAKLDVENGTVRFSDYGAGTNNGTETYLLAVEADGDVVEVDPASLSGSSDNIYNTNGTLQSSRIVNMDGHNLRLNGSEDIIFQDDGDVGIGTNSPNARLDVEGGDVRFSDYGGGTYDTGNETYLLAVEADGDIVEVDPSSLAGSSDNIYNTNGTLDANRTLTMSGNNLTFDATEDIVFQSDGDVGLGTSSIGGKLHLYETTGTLASANSGTMVLEHGNNGGANSIIFKSRVNSGSDYAYIQYQDNASGNGSSSENALLTIGIQNDVVGTYQDDIAIMPSGNLGVGTTSPNAKLDVENGTVRFSDYGAGSNNGTETYALAVDTDGDVIEMNTVKSSKFFYPPAISIDVSATGTDILLDLHQNYVNVFGTPAVSSSGAPTAIPYYAQNELYYYVTDYDNTIFSNITINANGVMEYDIISVPTTECSLINVVFVVK